MKMKLTDIGVVGFMYAVCAFFYVYSYDLSEGSRSYPRFTIALLFFLTTLYVIQMIVNAKRHGVTKGTDEVFEGFKPAQFFVCVLLTLAYFFMMKYLGFFSATVVFMAAALLYLKVPLLHAGITLVAVNLMIYLAFVQFLGVKLPTGLLF